MKDPTRLLDAGGNELELALLRAASAEEPSTESKRRLLSALGLSLPAASAAENDAQPAPDAASAAGSGSGSGLAAGLGAKWLALIGGSLILATLPIAYLNLRAPALPTSPAGHTAPSATAEVEPTRGRDEAALPQVQRVDTPPAPAGTPSVALEVARLDRVRNLLAASKTAAALRELDQYAGDFPSGVLRQEATLLRLESLVQAKRTLRARELAAQFLREHPESPHRDRIRALLDAHAR
jgi:hypothetical protein